MDAKVYLNKVNEICKVYENRGQCNEKCPLKKYGCGAPMKGSDIEDAIKIVEETELISNSVSEIEILQKEIDHRTQVENKAMDLIVLGKHQEALEILKTK